MRMPTLDVRACVDHFRGFLGVGLRPLGSLGLPGRRRGVSLRPEVGVLNVPSPGSPHG
jgi:hypothetical protein